MVWAIWIIIEQCWRNIFLVQSYNNCSCICHRVLSNHDLFLFDICPAYFTTRATLQPDDSMRKFPHCLSRLWSQRGKPVQPHLDASLTNLLFWRVYLLTNPFLANCRLTIWLLTSRLWTNWRSIMRRLDNSPLWNQPLNQPSLALLGSSGL